MTHSPIIEHTLTRIASDKIELTPAEDALLAVMAAMAIQLERTAKTNESISLKMQRLEDFMSKSV